ncbi:MAG: single-stranded DNA-binding protein [Pyrinomonadaceae bacterium]
MSFNKIILVGNLGRDPELRYTPQGTAVCSFSMATNERRRDSNGEFKEFATWFKVTLWGKQAETASKYLSKGKPIYIEGRLKLEEWTDREGNPRQTLEVNASDMQFIGSRNDDMSFAASGNANEFGSAPQSSDQGDSGSGPEEDDIPF